MLVVALVGLCIGSTGAHAVSDIDRISSLDANPRFAERHHTLHKLSAGDLESGAAQLIDFMREQQVPTGMRPVDYMSLVNDSFNLLVKNHIRADELLRLILEVIPDESADEVWRDYAVQKLGYTLDRQDISPATLDAGLAMLERVVRGEFPRVQGTGLIVAFKLSETFARTHPFLQKEALGGMALAGAKDEGALLIDRVTALQVAALCGRTDALSYAKLLIRNGVSDEQETMLLVSAIAVVGEQGGASERALVEAFHLSPDIRIRAATRTALQKIEARL